MITSLQSNSRKVCAALALVVGGNVAHAVEADRGLLQAANNAQADVISTLEQLVLVESGSSNRQGLEILANYVQERLEDLGAATDRIASSRADGVDVVRGVLKGSGRLRVLLIAHMDTVYEEGTLETEPFRRDGNRLYGPGIADDKGGVAVILHSLRLLLHDHAWNDFEHITVLFNPDEETGSVGSGEIIADIAEGHDVVLSFEPSAAKAVALHEGLLLGAAGTSRVTLSVQGAASHAGAAPEQGRNALIELSHQLLQTRDAAAEVPGAQLNWTTASSGTARNQIPDSARAGGDVRVTKADANKNLLAVLRARVRENPLVADTITTVELEPLRPIYEAGERGRALADLAVEIYSELDGRVLILHPGTNGGTDAGFAGRSGHAAVLEGFGLAGWGFHASNEYIEIDSIVPRLYLATRMLVELGMIAHESSPGQ